MPGGPALLRGLLSVCMNRSMNDSTPPSTDSSLKRLSSFQAAFSSSASCPAQVARNGLPFLATQAAQDPRNRVNIYDKFGKTQGEETDRCIHNL